MEQSAEMAPRERVVAALLAIAGTAAFVLSLGTTSVSALKPGEYLLALLFAGAIVLADQYPVHLLRGTKVSLINLPIFLAAALLPAPLVILATGAGLLIANLIARAPRGLLPRDIVSTIGQWMFTVFWGHQILHLSLSGHDWYVPRLVLLLLCAFLFLSVDFIVFSLSQSFIYSEPFSLTLKTVLREGALLEVVQYSIAILGTFAAYAEIWSLALLIVPTAITYIAFKNIKELRYETIQVLNDMADTVDLRDTYTGGHSKHVADLVHQTLVQLKIAGPEATLIEVAARLHDLGKIGIPDQILLKPGRLLPHEMAVMQTHAQKGAELISKYKDFARGAALIKHHHERWDGRGYPAGLKGHEIPFGARLIAVADSFEAMTSDRPYRGALSVDQAVQILLEGRGKQWDPTVVNTFVDMIVQQIDDRSKELVYKQETASVLSQTVLLSSQT